MNSWLIGGGVLIVVLVAWSLWGYFSSHVEQAKYTIEEEHEGYEVRQYAPHIEAQAVVSGSYDDALNQGFRIIAGYIFGSNAKKEPVAMTAPVTAGKKSEPIAMTAPVTAASTTAGYTIAFVMPAPYTLETLPTPNDSRVTLVEVPGQRVAAKRIYWWATAERVARAEADLAQELARDNIHTTGAPKYAGYNAPWTPPWLVRNEVLIPIQ